ncbi:MAG: hypothetical protein IAF58_22125 [Leptolyngbya sp.]|nr:hypothetical protein [Candidatus Melainabacteria bacterium]
MGHSILGRVALCECDIDLAKKHLSKMSKYGQADWRHDLKLATELIDVREYTAVVLYLDGCIQNLSKRLETLNKSPANPRKLPALKSMERDWHDESMDLTDFMRLDLTRKISKCEKWVATLAKDKKPRFPTFI